MLSSNEKDLLIHITALCILLATMVASLTFNLIKAFAGCTSGGGLCLADVWAGRLQFCTPDTKPIQNNIKLDVPGMSVERKPTTAHT